MASRQHKPEWELPSLREAHRLPGFNHDFWSIKFYPYAKPGVDEVFALVGGNHILLCRPPPAGNDNRGAEIIQFIIDDEPEEDFIALAWAKDLNTGEPLLCVAGQNANIKIISALTGKLLRTLPGHGGPINDLVVSPVNPAILASASLDYTIRIWSLDPAHEKQPCAAILEDAHREAVLSIGFHSTGRYLLSGGADHAINLWTLPEIPNKNTGTNKLIRIYYPHFSTSEIHADVVDSVAFYGDLILSKAGGEQCIVLWAIASFNSQNPPPSPGSAPTPHDIQTDTRSAFCPPTSASRSSGLYTRLIQFNAPDSQVVFAHFSLYPGNNVHNPVLAFCNMTSKVFFWDLDRLEAYHDLIFSEVDITDPAIRPSFLNPYQPRNRPSIHSSLSRTPKEKANSSAESSHNQETGGDLLMGEKGKGKVDWDQSFKNWAAKYEIGDPFVNISPHKEETVKPLSFTGRDVAWSNDGNWCAVAGSGGVFALLHRGGR